MTAALGVAMVLAVAGRMSHRPCGVVTSVPYRLQRDAKPAERNRDAASGGVNVIHRF